MAALAAQIRTSSAGLHACVGESICRATMRHIATIPISPSRCTRIIISIVGQRSCLCGSGELVGRVGGGATAALPPLPSNFPCARLRSAHPVAMTISCSYLGMGILGSAMAANLHKAGMKTTVWNRSADKCAELVALGCAQAATAAAAVAASDVTFACVSDPSAVEKLVFGPGGVLEGISEGKVRALPRPRARGGCAAVARRRCARPRARAALTSAPLRRHAAGVRGHVDDRRAHLAARG